MEFQLTIKDKGLPEIKYKHGDFTKKGYIDPKDCIKVLDNVKDILNKKNSEKPIKWLQPPKNAYMYDVDTDSIIMVLPEDTYYIPFVSSKDETLVFECKLPDIVAVKKKQSIYLFYIDDNEQLNPDSKLYPLRIGHVNDQGSVCLGTYKKVIDFNNPEAYFKELICYPVRHAEDVKTLRDVQANGFKKTYENKRILKTLL
jgi:hypothetical protein